MGWLDDFEHELGKFNLRVREARAFGADPRSLTHEDVEGWNEKASNRTPPKTRAAIIASISRSNPMRYARLRRDYRWLQKQARKHGLSPEDARWLF